MRSGPLSRVSGEAPVIKADDTPVKVLPAKAAGDQQTPSETALGAADPSGKPSQVVLTGAEQPVDVVAAAKACPAARFGGGPAPGFLRRRHSFRTGSGECSGRWRSGLPRRPSQAGTPPSPSAASAQPLPTAAANVPLPEPPQPAAQPSVFGTPHRVSTVSVKPDGTIVSNGKPKADAKVDTRSDAKTEAKAEPRTDVAPRRQTAVDHGVGGDHAFRECAHDHEQRHARGEEAGRYHPRQAVRGRRRRRSAGQGQAHEAGSEADEAQGGRSHAGRSGGGYRGAVADHAARTSAAERRSPAPQPSRKIPNLRRPRAAKMPPRAGRSRSSSPRAPRRAMRARPWRACKSSSRTSSEVARSIAPTSAARASSIACASAPCHGKPRTRSAPSSRPAARSAF